MERARINGSRSVARLAIIGTLWSLVLAMGAAGLTACQGSSSAVAEDAASRQRGGPVTVEPQADWTDAVVYFLILDRFADGDPGNNANVDRKNPGGWHGGDLKGLIQQLDEIAELGATAIWITPVPLQIEFAPIVPGMPETGGKMFEHWGFHGYWAEDFTLLDPHFGSEADLRALVDAAHQRGIKVLLDVVYNHPGYGSQYETDPRFKGWIRSKPVDCAAEPLTCQVGGLPDFDTDREDVRAYLFDAQLGLARRTGLDGFRLDTVKHIDHEFWQEHRGETRERIGDDFFLLGEVWGGDWRVLDDWFENDEMDAGFDFSFSGSCQGFVEGKGRTIAFASYLSKRHKVRDGYQLAHYMSSHDEDMALFRMNFDKQNFRLCVALQMTSFGIPVIYYGEEVGRKGGKWPTNRNPMPWGSRNIEPGKGIARDEDLRDFYKALIAARRDHRSLSRGTFEAIATDGDLLVFARHDEETGDHTVVALNRGESAAEFAFDVPAAWEGREVREVLGGTAANRAAGRITGSVAPKSVQIHASTRP